MAAVDDSSEATLDTDVKRKSGGCLNLGWGCLSVFVGGALLLPAGFFFY